MEIDPSSSSGALLLDSDGYDYVENTGNRIATVKTFTPDTSYEQRLIQQDSYMYQNRELYAIVGKSSDLVTYRNQAFTYTSFIQTPAAFEIDQTAQNGDDRSLDFYQYNVTMQQFHYFTVMPGTSTDDIATTSSIDYSKIKVSIVDTTAGYQDEVLRWELQGCGDGLYNTTTYTFEQCDRSAEPPQSPSNTYKYPTSSNWLRKDVYYDITTRDYYTCTDICQQQSVDLCGDGYESNGPYDQWDTSVYTKDTREYCDDGNNNDGDGCSSTCVVEYEWECMDDAGTDLWGPGSCRRKCGNGIVESYPAQPDGSTTFVEQCDLGSYNSDADTVYEHACDSTC